MNIILSVKKCRLQQMQPMLLLYYRTALNFQGANFSRIGFTQNFAEKIFADKNTIAHAYWVVPRPMVDSYEYVILLPHRQVLKETSRFESVSMMGQSGVDSFSIEVMICGCHVYQEIWDPALGEELACQWETVNWQDPFAVAVVRSTPVRTFVGHVPRKISSVCWMFLLGGGRIHCRVSGARRYSVHGVPSTENFRGFYFRWQKQIREIRENLVPRKFSTVWYVLVTNCFATWPISNCGHTAEILQPALESPLLFGGMGQTALALQWNWPTCWTGLDLQPLVSCVDTTACL